LAGLKRVIAAKRLPSFRALTATTDHAFYNEDTADNYAQARYLLYYLQEKGLLRRYYRSFLATRGADPTGYTALQRVLGTKDMDAFTRQWSAYVMGLTFP
jgi:hypothetical protein